MDAFYASVEQRNHPELRGKPVIVGGRPDSRGVVSTCSYEARKYGIHSAMPSAEAHRRCPHAIFVSSANFSEYRNVSQQIHEIFHEVTDKVEPMSLDEAYLDVSSNKFNEISATRLAQYLRRRIREKTELTASAGVSFNKSLAKIASDWQKPDGLTVIRPEEAESFLDNLPIGKFFGIGPVTANRMREIGIYTGKDLKGWPLWRLINEFGKAGPWYFHVCRGLDDREVIVEHTRKSLSRERTFARDKTNLTEMIVFILDLSHSVWDELRENNLYCKTISVKVKYNDFRQVTRSHSAEGFFDNLKLFQATVIDLLKSTDAASIPVRLLGVSASSFNQEEEKSQQLYLNLSIDDSELNSNSPL